MPREHEEEHVRADRDATHSDVADAGPGSRRAQPRVWRGTRRADQLSGAEPGPGARPAVEFARRSHPLAADYPVADWPRPETVSTVAVDAVPHARGCLPGT